MCLYLSMLRKLKKLAIMDKRQELLKKLDILVQEIDKAKKIVDDEKNQYLDNYENRIEVVIKKLRDDTLHYLLLKVGLLVQ